MPKVNFHIPFLDKDGEPSMEAEREKYKFRRNKDGSTEAVLAENPDGTIKMKQTMLDDVVSDILYDNYENDGSVPAVEKHLRGELAQKVLKAKGEVALTNEEVTMITELAGKNRPHGIGTRPTLVIQRIKEAINAE